MEMSEAVIGAVAVGAGAGGIAQGIGGIIQKIIDAIVGFLKWVARTILRIARWYFNLLKEKPEWGITIPILLIYFFS